MFLREIFLLILQRTLAPLNFYALHPRLLQLDRPYSPGRKVAHTNRKHMELSFNLREAEPWFIGFERKNRLYARSVI